MTETSFSKVQFNNVKYNVIYLLQNIKSIRSSRPEMFLGKGVLKICSKFTGEHPCRRVILIQLQSNFIEITLRFGRSLVNLLYVFRTTFPKNNSGEMLLTLVQSG